LAKRNHRASLPLAILGLLLLILSPLAVSTHTSASPTLLPSATTSPSAARTTAIATPVLLLLATQPRFTFDQTDQVVTGQFLIFWQANGGLLAFGYPISPVLLEQGYQVQYFERQRFEYHPEEAGTQYEVQLGLLGTEMARAQGRNFNPPNPTNAATRTSNQAYFAETKRLVASPFYPYWQANGASRGLRLYGLPISDEFIEGNLIVQFFERARFERPLSKLRPSTNDVQLALLGTDYYRFRTTGATAASPPAANPAAPPTLSPSAIVIPSATASPTATPTPTGGAGGYPFLSGPHVGGGLIAQIYGQDKGRVMATTKGANFSWLKQQILWKDTENPKGTFYWGELDNIVNAANAAGINLMINVDKAPIWARAPEEVAREPDGYPVNADDMADFMAAMADRYQGRIRAYEIWNEANLHNESGRAIDPGFYVEMLAKSYHAVKSHDPNAIIILGAASPTGVNEPGLAMNDVDYTEQLFQYKGGMVRHYYDVLGVHPYGYNNPPETLWPDQPSPAKEYKTHPSFYFRRVEQIRAVQEKYGDGEKQIWVTEYGWCSDKRPGGFGGCEELDERQVADFLVRANRLARDKYPWMGPMFLWNLNFSTFLPWYDGPSHFSLVNADWSPRPSYNAMHDLLAKP